jgi:hypothetical protein
LQSAVDETSWDPNRLGQVISEEFKKGLKTIATMIIWRHSVIAISRRHLQEGSKFKRDYGADETSTAMDLQAAHTSISAGICYARDHSEGPFPTASLRAEFRAISRHWHICLGFGVPREPREAFKLVDKEDTSTPLGDLLGNRFQRKRASEEDLEAELNDWLRDEQLLRPRNKKARKASKEQENRDSEERERGEKSWVC